MDKIASPITCSRGVTSSYEGVLVFRNKLQIMITTRQEQSRGHMQDVLTLLEKLITPVNAELWNRDQESYVQALPAEQELKYLLIKCHTKMTDFILQSRVKYIRLVCQHLYATIQESPLYERAAFREHSSNLDAADGAVNSEYTGLHSQTMLMYFERVLPAVVKLVVSLTNKAKYAIPISAEEVEDAWISMMLRAFCWQRCHHMMEGIEPLPSEYWDSKMPVYIG